MAEFLPGILQSILGKVTDKLATTLSDTWNLEPKRKKFEMQLLCVQSLMEDSESCRRPTVKKLIKKAQYVLDEAEEVVEDLIYNARYAEAQHGMSWSQKALMTVNQSKPFLGSFVLSRNLDNALNNLKDLATQLRDAGVVEHGMPPQATITQKTSPIDGFMEIVGRQDARNSLVELLLAQEDQQEIQVVPIVGIGGLGKTALAKLVYYDLRVKDHFAVKAWYGACYDICSVLKSLIESITDGKWDKGMDVLHLQQGLREAISHRRILIILDDYPSSDLLFEEKLTSALCSYCGPGSCILLTTRSIPVTSKFITLQPYHLQSLNEHDAWEMFSRTAFSNGQEGPEFVALGRDIVKMCKGLPLAVKVISGLMQTKMTLEDWEAVTKSEIKDNACFSEGVMAVLLLSYNQLSSQEKQCFVLTSLFPKGTEIDSEKLIQLWAANSFLGEEHGNDVDKKGSLILSSFIAKGFLQDTKMTEIEPGFEVLTVKMHDFLHDLAKAVTNGCATSEDLLSNMDSVEDVRHILINIGAFENERIGSVLRDMKTVKTSLIATDKWTIGMCHDEMGEHWRQLRLRSLRALQCAYAPHLHRHLVCSLHLRYLDLSYLPLVTVPDSLCRLYSLQTLRLINCEALQCLPDDLANLKHLRHIYNLGCIGLKRMPPNLSRLNLHTLTVFVVDNDNGRGIEELEQMNKLSNRLELWNLERVESSSRAKKANLVKKTHVTDLVLYWSQLCDSERLDIPDDDERFFKARAGVANNHRDVMMALEPHKELKYLQLFGYCGSTVAKWTRAPWHFQCLKRLSILKCPWLDEIPAVWFSCTLEELFLIKMESLSTLVLVSGKDDSNTALPIFPGLKRMHLSALPRFKIWAGNRAERYKGPIMLPKLENLVMHRCHRVVDIPECPVLREIKVTACSSLDLRKMQHLHLLQDIAYGSPAIFRMHMDSWPTLRTLKFSGLLNMKLLPPKNHISHQRDPRNHLSHQRNPRLRRSDHKLMAKSESGQNYESEQIEIVEKCFKNLEHLSLEDNCFTGLVSLPVEVLQLWTCFSHVKSLQITSREIVAWPAEVRLLTSLKKLHIACCTQLTGLDKNGDGVLPPTLLELIIQGCHSLVKLPHLPSSLESLTIENCRRVEFFSDEVTFPSLQKLRINGCPRLQDLCVSGEKYHDTIAHIPHKEIEIVIRKTPWFTKRCSSIESCLVA